ncbi:G-type lectin S-receptor-like serine/threonine-protein kinase LECRK3 [Tanacetum coccineum]
MFVREKGDCCSVIWYPEGGPTVPTGSKVELTDGRGLVLSDPQSRDVWSTGPTSDITYGVMNDTSNFVIVGNNSRKIWESFNFPTDTMLPTQVIERGGVIYSKIRRANFTRGRNGKRYDLTPNQELLFGDYYHRVTLDFDGVFTQYYHPKDSTDNSSWGTVCSYPENICLSFCGIVGSGACGFNNVCSLNQGNRPKCECPRGFSLLDPSDPNGHCKPYFFPSCEERESKVDNFEFLELTDNDSPTSNYGIMNPTTETGCKTSCLNDCFCAVAIYKGNKCDLPPGGPPCFSGEKNNQQSLTIAGSALFEKIRKLDPGGNSIETNVIRFKFKELLQATKGFKYELEKGDFGRVYKGVIGTTTVVVKKLDIMVQDGEKEF